jgi:glycosyltransferase involved in cell wall biosynthesis
MTSPQSRTRPKPAISVCVPAYNGAEYLVDCLESVLAQSFHDYELLIVDDCSSDDTSEIASRYAAKDVRVRLSCNSRTLGLVGNWNCCVELAKGDWVKFVFQDDVIAPNCLERMLAAAEPDTLLISCRRDFIFEEGTSEDTRQFYQTHISVEDVFPGQTKISPSAYCDATLENIGINFVGEPTAVMLHRKAFDQFGDFNPLLIMICDSEYWARVGIHSGLAYVPESLAKFRVHAGATSAANFASRRYRMELDAVVLVHEFCFSPAYEPLRIAASRRESPLDLGQRLSTAARGAKWLAVDAAKRVSDPDPSLMEEWTQIVKQYPRLAALAQNEPSPAVGVRERFVERVRDWRRRRQIVK